MKIFGASRTASFIERQFWFIYKWFKQRKRMKKYLAINVCESALVLASGQKMLIKDQDSELEVLFYTEYEKGTKGGEYPKRLVVETLGDSKDISIAVNELSEKIGNIIPILAF